MRAAAGATVVVLVGAARAVGDELVRGLGRLPNVQALRVQRGSDDGAQEGAWAAAWEGAREVAAVIAGAATPYVVHDLDPLGRVAEAWVGFFDDPTTRSVLHVEVESALTTFAAGAAVMPDYYIVLDPEALSAHESQWWLGVLAAVAPARVLPVPGRIDAVKRALATLPAGRAWPDPAGWLRGLEQQVPDRAGLL